MTDKARGTGKRAAGVMDGSGNVFADLGIPDSEQELLKAKLSLKIYSILKGSRMTKMKIAKNLSVPQPQASLLMRNRAGSFSVGRLMEFLTALRRDVQITVRPSRKAQGALSVTFV